jgi:hypothetical protein
MQKDQRLLPVFRHLGDSETINQNADIAGSTLNAFCLFITSVSAPISLAHYSLANRNPNAVHQSGICPHTACISRRILGAFVACT